MFIVICHQDAPVNTVAYTLACHRVFERLELAQEYASTVSAHRKPLVVSGEFFGLRLDLGEPYRPAHRRETQYAVGEDTFGPSVR